MTASTASETHSTILWVRADSDNALDAMAAVERALHGDTTAIAPPPGAAGAASEGASYLADNLALARATWALDPQAIVVSNRPYAAWAVNRFQRIVRRATWWYALPQWLQANEFHGAVVRVLDVLSAHQSQLLERIGALESQVHAGQTQMLEHQLYTLRGEHQELLRRVAALEDQLARLDAAGTARQAPQ